MDTMNHDSNVAKCNEHGAMLPEPRDMHENHFLHNMAADGMFYLGMTDRWSEGTWVWNSDGTYVQNHWAPGQQRGHCAYMFKDVVKGGDKWCTVSCSHDAFFDQYNKHLICQGTCVVIFSI